MAKYSPPRRVPRPSRQGAPAKLGDRVPRQGGLPCLACKRFDAMRFLKKHMKSWLSQGSSVSRVTRLAGAPSLNVNRPQGSKALFIWSRVTETTLPPSYPGQANFSLISLKNSTSCLHENANSSRGGRGGGARQLGWASCLVSAGRVTLSGGATFSHINTLARLPEARWLKLFPEPAI